MSLLTLRGLFERLRAPSQSQKGHFPEKMKLKKWHQNSWHWQKSAHSSEIFVASRGICQSVGVSSRKRGTFSILDKNGAHKNKASLTYTFDLMGGVCVWTRKIATHKGIFFVSGAKPSISECTFDNTFSITRRRWISLCECCEIPRKH